MLVSICTYNILHTYFKQQNRTTKLQEAAAAVALFASCVCVVSTTPKVRSGDGDTSIHLASLLREFNSVDFWALSNERRRVDEVTFLDVLTRYVSLREKQVLYFLL